MRTLSEAEEGGDEDDAEHIPGENGTAASGASRVPVNDAVARTMATRLEKSLTMDSMSTSRSFASSRDSQRAHANITLETSEREVVEAVEAAMCKGAPSVLCCSRDDPEDYQVDLCPRSWFNLRDSPNFCSAVWKVCFICCCLPLCYPCYLTRKFRRKSKRVIDSPDITASYGGPQKLMVIRAHKVEEESEK